MKTILSILLFLTASLTLSAETKIPGKGFTNFENFYVFGPEGSKSFGKDDSLQIIYLAVPSSLKSFTLKVNGPGSTTSYERSCIDGKPAKTVFKVIGGTGALKEDASGKVLKEISSIDDSGSVSLGSFSTSAGEVDGDTRIFKVHVQAVEGENINFFSLTVDSSEIEVFAYNLSIHAHALSGDTIKFGVEVPKGVTQINEMNYDMAEDLNLFLGGKELKGSLNGQRVFNKITPSSFGRTEYKLVSDDPDFNNVAFYLKDQNGRYLRTYLTPEKAALAPEPVKPKPAPKYNECEIETSLVKLQNKAPMKGAVGEDIVFEMIVTAKQAVKDVVVSGPKPKAGTIVSSSPKVKVQGENIFWVFPQMDKGETKTIKLTLKATDEGVLGLCTGIFALPRVCKTTVVGKASLTIKKTGPTSALLGQEITYSMTVKNTGNVLAKNVVITDELPEGLMHSSNSKSVSLKVGDLKPGESKTVNIKTKAVKRGRHCNVATAKAVNAQAVKDEACTVIVKPGLKVEKTGDKTQFVGKRATYKIVVTNTGDTSLNNVVTVDTLPAGIKVLNSGGGLYKNGQITWTTPVLKPGAKKEFTVIATSLTAGTLCNTASVKDDSGLKDSARACTAWKGFPALLLEVIDTKDPLLIGGDTTYVIRVTNQGTANDAKVRISALFPAEITPQSVVGSTKGNINGKKVDVQPFAILKPKQVIEWTIKAKAVKTGDARLKVQMFSELLKTPVNEEESTHVY